MPVAQNRLERMVFKSVELVSCLARRRGRLSSRLTLVRGVARFRRAGEERR
jgi:hypothetical protein